MHYSYADLSLYACGEAPAAETRLFERHLKECRQCRQWIDWIQGVLKR
jgi:predicted anti-sigma-YlaC factor YlaD